MIVIRSLALVMAVLTGLWAIETAVGGNLVMSGFITIFTAVSAYRFWQLRPRRLRGR